MLEEFKHIRKSTSITIIIRRFLVCAFCLLIIIAHVPRRRVCPCCGLVDVTGCLKRSCARDRNSRTIGVSFRSQLPTVCAFCTFWGHPLFIKCAPQSLWPNCGCIVNCAPFTFAITNGRTREPHCQST